MNWIKIKIIFFVLFSFKSYGVLSPVNSANFTVKGFLSQREQEAQYFQRAIELFKLFDSIYYYGYMIPSIPELKIPKNMDEKNAMVLLDYIAMDLMDQLPLSIKAKIKNFYYGTQINSSLPNSMELQPWGKLFKSRDFSDDLRLGEVKYIGVNNFQVILPKELATNNTPLLFQIAKINTIIFELSMNMMRFNTPESMHYYRTDYYPMDFLVQAVVNSNNVDYFSRIEILLLKEVSRLDKDRSVSSYFSELLIKYVTNPSSNKPFLSVNFEDSTEDSTKQQHEQKYAKLQRSVLLAMEDEKKKRPLLNLESFSRPSFGIELESIHTLKAFLDSEFETVDDHEPTDDRGRSQCGRIFIKNKYH